MPNPSKKQPPKGPGEWPSLYVADLGTVPHKYSHLNDYLEDDFGTIGGKLGEGVPWPSNPVNVKVVQPQKSVTEESDHLTVDIKKTTLSDIIKAYTPCPNIGLGVSFKYQNLSVMEGYKDIPPIKERHKDVLLGIEIELEQWSPNHVDETLAEKIYKLWEGKADNSLRNSGIEFISKPGLTAGEVKDALFLLKKYLKAACGGLQANYRCGTHVHVGVRNFTVEQLLNFCMLYVLFEASFYKMSGDRWKNIYCVPIRASSSEMEKIFQLVHKSKPTYQDFRKLFKGFKKYMAFNLLPAGHYPSARRSAMDMDASHNRPIGTVEFRHHEGTSDPAVLLPWIQLILDIHYAAQQYSFEELRDKIFELNTHSQYCKFAESIFTKMPVSRAHTYEHVARDMAEGSAFIKELYIMATDQ